jgi:hypothetical protein
MKNRKTVEQRIWAGVPENAIRLGGKGSADIPVRQQQPNEDNANSTRDEQSSKTKNSLWNLERRTRNLSFGVLLFDHSMFNVRRSMFNVRRSTLPRDLKSDGPSDRPRDRRSSHSGWHRKGPSCSPRPKKGPGRRWRKCSKVRG